MAKWRKDSDAAALAAYVERAKAEGDPTGFASRNFVWSEFEIVLSSYVDLVVDIPELEKRRIVSKVVHDASIKRPITAASLLASCSRLEREYLELPRKSFRLLTEISVGSQLEVPLIRLGTTTLSFRPKTEVGFKARAELFRRSRAGLGFDLPADYTPLAALVSARSPYEAAERALNDIDLVRASWNLALNQGKAWRYSSGRPAPVNDIRLSPFHTLHDRCGHLAIDSWWYDPGYSKPARLFSDKSRFPKLLRVAQDLRTRVSRSPYRSDVESALIRYVRALDSADLGDAFLRLWSLLEFLTDSGQDPYKVAIRRAAFMFADQERSLLILTHLANYRNRFVHAGSETDEIEPLVFLLKRYVDALLLFHIRNRFDVVLRAEAARFMDLPHSREEIDTRIKRLRDARKFVAGVGGA